MAMAMAMAMTYLVASAWSRAELQQNLAHGRTADRGREVQRCRARGRDGVHVGALLQQQEGRVRLALPRRHVQRCLVELLAAAVDVGALLEQQLDGLDLPDSGRDMQRRSLVLHAHTHSNDEHHSGLVMI